MELDKRSYTARQLYHLTPEKLHHATHRVLIGHAPTDWLVRSNRRWRSAAKAFIKDPRARLEGELARLDGWERRAGHFFNKFKRNMSVNAKNPLVVGEIPRMDFAPAAQAGAAAAAAGPNGTGGTGPSSHEPTQFFDTYDIDSIDLDSASTYSSQQMGSVRASGEFTAPKHNRVRGYLRRALLRKQDRAFFHRKRGEILFVRQFLVQVREAKGLSSCKELDRYILPLSTVKERSKEYTAVARWTGRPEAPVAIYLYASAEVTRKVDHRWSRALKHKIVIDAHTRGSFFDTLDMSVAVWNSAKKPKPEDGVQFYLFLCQNTLVQVAWLYFIMHASNPVDEPFIHIKIPDLDVSLRLQMGAIRASQQFSEEKDTVKYTELRSPIANISGFVQNACSKATEVYNRVGTLDPKEKYILCWRHLDFVRILLFDTDFHAMTSHALLQNNYLEFHKVYTLTSVEEPAAIEGFCWRLTTWRGQGRKQKIVTRTYLHSHNHMLFYMQPNKAILPNFTINGQVCGQEEYLSEAADEQIREFLEALPIVSEINPFPLDENNEIAWATNPDADPEVGRLHDTEAVFEQSRGMANIESSDGFIDMTTITNVRSLSNSQMFEITLDNEFNILIRVAEPEARNAWVDRLRNLCSYWKTKTNQLREAAKTTYVNNMAQNTNFILRSKLESTFILPNMTSFVIETPACTRCIVHSGYLYSKTHKHGFFREYYAVLTGSSLVLYKLDGHSYEITQNDRKVTSRFTVSSVYDLVTSYIYTGSLATEYLYRENEDAFDFAQMYDGVPRTYGHDWVVQDREADCCFVLWNEVQKGVISTITGVHEGRRICMARSRIERDLWVNAIQMVTMRLSVLRDGNSIDVNSIAEMSE